MTHYKIIDTTWSCWDGCCTNFETTIEKDWILLTEDREDDWWDIVNQDIIFSWEYDALDYIITRELNIKYWIFDNSEWNKDIFNKKDENGDLILFDYIIIELQIKTWKKHINYFKNNEEVDELDYKYLLVTEKDNIDFNKLYIDEIYFKYIVKKYNKELLNRYEECQEKIVNIKWNSISWEYIDLDK